MKSDEVWNLSPHVIQMSQQKLPHLPRDEPFVRQLRTKFKEDNLKTMLSVLRSFQSFQTGNYNLVLHPPWALVSGKSTRQLTVTVGKLLTLHKLWWIALTLISRTGHPMTKITQSAMLHHSMWFNRFPCYEASCEMMELGGFSCW